VGEPVGRDAAAVRHLALTAVTPIAWDVEAGDGLGGGHGPGAVATVEFPASADTLRAYDCAVGITKCIGVSLARSACHSSDRSAPTASRPSWAGK